MAELLHRAIELFILDRLFDDGDGAVGEDAAEDFAIGVARDDDDGEVGVQFFELGIDFITRDVGQFQVEEYEVELLLARHSDGFRSGADDEASEASFFEELLEQGLEGGVVIDDHDGGLPGLVFFAQHVAVE